jgi:hypothetical protein
MSELALVFINVREKYLQNKTYTEISKGGSTNTR